MNSNCLISVPSLGSKIMVAVVVLLRSVKDHGVSGLLVLTDLAEETKGDGI